MNKKNLDNLITEALAMEAEEAEQAGAIGYMARTLTQATMPHRNVMGSVFERENGLFTLTMMSPPKIGLPYGSYPRLLLSWITTEAVRTKDYELLMGSTLTGFMAELGLLPRGGRWGTIHRLKDQMTRLFTCSVSCDYREEGRDAGLGYRIAKAYNLWWNPKSPDQAALWGSTVTLSRDFFDEIIERPVPIDLRALKQLKRSPMALDIYCWLTYRMSYLKRHTVIPWGAIQLQFGADYADTPQGRQGFKRNFIRALRSVCLIYPGVKALPTNDGVALKPSKTHIPTLERV